MQEGDEAPLHELNTLKKKVQRLEKIHIPVANSAEINERREEARRAFAQLSDRLVNREGHQREAARKKFEDAYSAVEAACLPDAQIHIWEGFLDKEMVADLMKKGKVVSSQILRKSGTWPEKITLDNGIVAICKPISDDVPLHLSYASEIAAYQMDELLGLGIVPLTVEREIDGEKASLQLWVNDFEGKSILPLTNNALFFKDLIAKWDQLDVATPTGGNAHFLANDHQQIVLFDHANAFFEEHLPTGFSDTYRKAKHIPDPTVLKAAKELSMEKMQHIEHLNEKQKQDLLNRRTMLLQAITEAMTEGQNK